MEYPPTHPAGPGSSSLVGWVGAPSRPGPRRPQRPKQSTPPCRPLLLRGWSWPSARRRTFSSGTAPGTCASLDHATPVSERLGVRAAGARCLEQQHQRCSSPAQGKGRPSRSGSAMGRVKARRCRCDEILAGAALVTPSEVIAEGWLEVSGGLITAMGSGPPPRPPDRDLGGGYLCPGFLDIHCHGGGGVSVAGADPGRDRAVRAGPSPARHDDGARWPALGLP